MNLIAFLFLSNFLLIDAQILTTPFNIFQTVTTTTTPAPLTFTLSPGTAINTTLLSQRPDENALNSFLSRLTQDQQTAIRNIRGNIFLTLSQQNDQITSYLTQQNANLNALYQQIQSAKTALSQNITSSLPSLTPEAQSFVQRRQQVLDNNAIALFDFSARLSALGSEFNQYNDSLKNEIYNFLINRQITGNFVPDVTSTTSSPYPTITLDDSSANQLLSMVYFDGSKLPFKSFIDLLPQEQQTQFNNIINNNNLGKSQISQQLTNLATGWGPQYINVFNSTMNQKNQMMQIFMLLRPGLTEPYKSFVDRKLSLMNNMTITTGQESQSMNSLANSFTQVKNAINQFSSSK
uniref:Uncharacterized protein n=1 Tax=Panagrolaimus sp. JU765 TaxID=591449 RepID=A0AC34Q9K5_9BILA